MKKEIADYLHKTVQITIDRQLGSKHPKHEWLYPINYGFVPGTKNADGEEIDAYLLGVDKPVTEFEGVCVAIIHRINDDDDKLIIVPTDYPPLSEEEIRKQTHFQEQYFESIIYK